MSRDTLGLPFDGEALRDRRERAGLTRPGLARKVAEATGGDAEPVSVSPYHLSRLEAGKSKPRPRLLRALADALGCTIDDLLGGKG